MLFGLDLPFGSCLLEFCVAVSLVEHSSEFSLDS